jgi:hypothetical protein
MEDGLKDLVALFGDGEDGAEEVWVVEEG